MAKRTFDIELICNLTIEVDDEVTSEAYPGETVLTAHANEQRFIAGTERDDALMHAAITVGVEGRRLSMVDGWADFSDEAVRLVEGHPHWDLISARERITR